MRKITLRKCPLKFTAFYTFPGSKFRYFNKQTNKYRCISTKRVNCTNEGLGDFTEKVFRSIFWKLKIIDWRKRRVACFELAWLTNADPKWEMWGNFSKILKRLILTESFDGCSALNICKWSDIDPDERRKWSLIDHYFDGRWCYLRLNHSGSLFPQREHCLQHIHFLVHFDRPH